MDAKQWQSLADKFQDSCIRVSRSLVVGHLVSVLFIVIGAMIPGFPLDQVFTLQFMLVCISLAIMGMVASVNYMFTLFAIKQIGEQNHGRKE